MFHSYDLDSQFKMMPIQSVELPPRSPCVPGSLVCSGGDRLKQQVCVFFYPSCLDSCLHVCCLLLPPPSSTSFQWVNLRFLLQVCVWHPPPLPIHDAPPGAAAPLRHLPHLPPWLDCLIVYLLLAFASSFSCVIINF